MTVEETTDQRRLHRHEINGLIDVIDQDTNETIGKLANVHSEGMLLLCPQPLALSRVYRLQLSTQGDIELPWMEVTVECRWLNQAVVDDRFQVGCSIVEADQEALAVLQQLDL